LRSVATILSRRALPEQIWHAALNIL
jgi:hypothetical protein